MRIGHIVTLFFLITPALAPASQEQIGSLPNGDKYISNKLIVTTKFNSPALRTDYSVSGSVVTGVESINDLCRELGVISVGPFYTGNLSKPNLLREVGRIYIFVLRDGIEAKSVLDRMALDPRIDFAELYLIPGFCYTPNDPRFGEQWFLPFVHADDCWNTVRGDTTRHAVIGIVDSGVYWDHPDLLANIWINEAEDVNHNGILDSGDIDHIDADGNGYVDDVLGWDFGNHDNNPIEDLPFHGTIVAGCASEVTDNETGAAGIGFSARLMCAKITNSEGMVVGAYQGFIYAADNGADVINCSFATRTFSRTEQNIINAAYQDGAYIVASAGNDNGQDTVYPAGYLHVLSVTGTDQDDHLIPGFGYGPWVDICAPGISMLSTWGPSGYEFGEGTSISAPFVSGFAALVKAWLPDYNPDQLDTLIRISADSIGAQNPSWPQAIRINAVNWLSLVGIKESPTPADYALSQNYPNPFNARTIISYSLPKASDVTIDIFDLLGRKIETIAEGTEPAGKLQAVWDATKQSSGIYFYRLKAGDKTETRKMVLMK